MACSALHIPNLCTAFAEELDSLCMIRLFSCIVHACVQIAQMRGKSNHDHRVRLAFPSTACISLEMLSYTRKQTVLMLSVLS